MNLVMFSLRIKYFIWQVIPTKCWRRHIEFWNVKVYKNYKFWGQIGVSVWGRREKSDYMTIVEDVFEENGINYEKTKAFYLGKKSKLIGML